MLKIFLSALHSKTKLRVHFYSKEDGKVIIRTCAPIDYGPSRRDKIKFDKFQFWDYGSDTKPHPLPLELNQLRKLEILEKVFDPGEFVSWDLKKSPWFIKRDWGNYS